jgi:MbtH protein
VRTAALPDCRAAVLFDAGQSAGMHKECPINNLRSSDTYATISAFVGCLGNLTDRELSAMSNPFEDDDGNYLVLINEEAQYSLWPAFLDIPLGWKVVGPQGKRSVCLAWIDQNWTDMRPLSLVRQMEADARSGEKHKDT